MHAWESIQKVLDYLEDNLALSHSSEELSRIAALSPFYFQRLFTRLVKCPVNVYVKKRRLAKACGALENKSRRILDIALDCGFNSHAHFTKSFKCAFGITPEEYRSNPVRLNQFMKPDLLLGYTMIDENVPLITDSIVLEISRKKLNGPERYIGLSGLVPVARQMPLGETTGVDVPGLLWDQFHREKDGIRGLAPKGIEFGASSMGGNDGDFFSYFVGAAAMPGATAYDDFVIWGLPVAEYIICAFEAENIEELVTAALNKSMNYLLNSWLLQHHLSIQPFSAEKYTNIGPD